MPQASIPQDVQDDAQTAMRGLAERWPETKIAERSVPSVAAIGDHGAEDIGRIRHG